MVKPLDFQWVSHFEGFEGGEVMLELLRGRVQKQLHAESNKKFNMSKFFLSGWTGLLDGTGCPSVPEKNI